MPGADIPPYSIKMFTVQHPNEGMVNLPSSLVDVRYHAMLARAATKGNSGLVQAFFEEIGIRKPSDNHVAAKFSEDDEDDWVIAESSRQTRHEDKRKREPTSGDAASVTVSGSNQADNAICPAQNAAVNADHYDNDTPRRSKRVRNDIVYDKGQP